MEKKHKLVEPRQPNKFDRIIGENLRLIRIQRKLSQTEIAEMTGITFQQIQKYERGSNRISASRLYTLSSLLDVPLMDFFQRLEMKTGSKSIHLESTDFKIIDMFKSLSASQRKTVVAMIKALNQQ